MLGLDDYPADPDGHPADGKVQEVTGGWRLLDDRLGVRITSDSLADWKISEPGGGAEAPYPGGAVDVVRAIAGDGEDDKAFVLVLVTEIETDWTVAGERLGNGADSSATVEAGRRASSPVKREVRRADDVRDRFRAAYFLLDEKAEDEACHASVDREKARLNWHLTERRNRHEMPSVAGSVTIPRISYAYSLGDRIHGLYGRGLRFHMNATPDPATDGIFPAVVAISRTFGSQFSTTLSLGDRRADARPVPKRYR